MQFLTIERLRVILAAFNRYNAILLATPRSTSPFSDEALAEGEYADSATEWKDYLQLLNSLSRDELHELAAIYYLGRGSGKTLEAGSVEAKNIQEQHLAQHIAGKGNLNQIIPVGLRKLGIQI